MPRGKHIFPPGFFPRPLGPWWRVSAPWAWVPTVEIFSWGSLCGDLFRDVTLYWSWVLQQGLTKQLLLSDAYGTWSRQPSWAKMLDLAQARGVVPWAVDGQTWSVVDLGVMASLRSQVPSRPALEDFFERWVIPWTEKQEPGIWIHPSSS